MTQSLPLHQRVQQKFPSHALGTHQYLDDQTMVLKREGLLPVAQFLRDDPEMAFNVLMDLSCVDFQRFGRVPANAPTLTTPSPLPYFMPTKPPAEPWERLVGSDYRFDVVYHFYSMTHNHRLRLRVPVAAADPVVDSLTGLWQSADWFEREVWDMFGIRFAGHPNLKRILMYEAFQGHPLRKDYPVYKRQPIIGPQN